MGSLQLLGLSHGLSALILIWKWDCDPKNCPDPRYRHNFRYGLRLPKSGSLLRGLDSDYGTSFKCSACHCGAWNSNNKILVTTALGKQASENNRISSTLSCAQKWGRVSAFLEIQLYRSINSIYLFSGPHFLWPIHKLCGYVQILSDLEFW
jgi:hypothetical protein